LANKEQRQPCITDLTHNGNIFLDFCSVFPHLYQVPFYLLPLYQAVTHFYGVPLCQTSDLKESM